MVNGGVSGGYGALCESEKVVCVRVKWWCKGEW